MKYEAIHRYRSEHQVVKMCQALGIRESGYYQWCQREEKRKSRALRDFGLILRIEKVFYEAEKTYGFRRIYNILKKEGTGVSAYKIRRLMRESGLYPVTSTKFTPYPEVKSEGRYSDNHLKQEFTVTEPDKVWAGDITYIKSTVGWVYLSVVIDLFNREVVGYSISKSPNTELVKRVLSNALASRNRPLHLTFHSDRGVQYSSNGYHAFLSENDIISSMSKPGCPYDNSCVESFFATTKRECLNRRRYDTMEEIENDIFEYIQIFYNRKRIHSTLGYMSPVDYRRMKEGGIST
jgi:putative transposase